MDDRRRGQRGPGAPAEPSGNAPAVELQDFLDHVNRGAVIEGGSDHHLFMHGAAQDALRIVAQINTGYRTPEEVRELLADLTGKPVDDSVAVFPPFYSEFGKNLTLGKDVFINSRVSLPGHRGHHDRGRLPHRPRQHPDDPQPRHRPRPAGRHDPIAGDDRPQGVARRRSDDRPRRDDRRRRDRRRWLSRDQRRTGQHDRRRRSSQAHPGDGLRRPSEMSPRFCSNARSTPRTPANANPASGPTPGSRAGGSSARPAAARTKAPRSSRRPSAHPRQLTPSGKGLVTDALILAVVIDLATAELDRLRAHAAGRLGRFEPRALRCARTGRSGCCGGRKFRSGRRPRVAARRIQSSWRGRHRRACFDPPGQAVARRTARRTARRPRVS